MRSLALSHPLQSPAVVGSHTARKRSSGGLGLRCRARALAWLLTSAASVGSAWAVVPAQEMPGGAEASATPLPCTDAAAAHAALQPVMRQLREQGMEMRASCHAATGAWVVQVRVVNGFQASKVVRGPLADGHDVDMGTPAGVELAGAPVDAAGFSPDVQFNRQWLRSLMAQHQFNNLPDAWWRYALKGSAPSSRRSTDVAIR